MPLQIISSQEIAVEGNFWFTIQNSKVLSSVGVFHGKVGLKNITKKPSP